MLVVVSDTHSTDGHRLANRTLEAVREADLVVHAGDFMRESVLDAFIAESESFLAVYGNNDGPEIRDRIPEARNFTYGGVEFAMTHTRRGGGTALSLFGRERGADAVIFGHSHRPTFDGTGAIPLLNPGSHAQPRGNRQAHAELEELPDGGLRGRLVTVDGDVFETFRVIPEEH
ncbi:metallophosphoesterase [Haloferax mediterranei ATCC 33500]|uniref:Phosphoesterase n=1 Tax=Haloferax mediterranei (strain ATCC 33500 / DSM 1411 / JCM 8866 / NBRC 14739 / NCIMB 2177 / R-4) TaxID=523841 RepID=I3R182_HALMT|nr:metallophosphoesterase [Haloferax mediterranei]AFK17992.1 phosphoesterase,metallo-phosphoesterase-calcineu rin-like protein [Haloferax mediterranei ATCC 33500]AHZ22589.1 phosphoesterase [Haloferax mediterranei ATCC 33500]EMA02732.1 phosphoesterase,metallo-phosphoesterase-calcineu rin-like protein [Haloferax mediterranei ATCC 33500]MDX5988084.1 metallophosphoesterase [Haloferax mediterranei ATCC 33500]QCQ74538.1 metallophosphoesterase [Haloferax mediterranei ATCC 33500]